MRVLFLLRSDASRLAAGPTEQVRQYARAVTAHGGTAVIHTAHDRPAGRFDIAHVVNLDWPLESARQMDIALECADRVLLSPIHHHRPWVEAFHAAGRHGLGARVAGRVGLEGFERLRGAAQALPLPRLWPEASVQLVSGVTRRQRDMLRAASMWIVLSERETQSIVSDFSVTPTATRLVVNGADWIDEEVSLPPLPDEFVLSVARLEARKNQLAVARALVELGLPGVFVGIPNPRHRAYVRHFEAYVDGHPSLTWLRRPSRPQTLALFRRARLHVLASWYEVAPIVDLEATVAGCGAVTTTRGYSRDALGDSATYWEPDTGHDGLVRAIREALERPRDTSMAARFRDRFSWERIGDELVAIYRESLGLGPDAGPEAAR